MRERQDGATGASRTADATAEGGVRPTRVLLVTTLAAILMTIIGAFGTEASPLSTRLAYWIVVMETGALLGIGGSTGVRSWGRLTAQPIIEGGVISLLIAAPLTLMVFGLNVVLFGASAPTLGSVVTLFGSVLAVTCAVTAVNYSSSGPRLPRHAVLPEKKDQAAVASSVVATASGTSGDQPRAALLERLAPHLRNEDLHAMQAEDHYLRVYTAAGSDLILLRLGDALKEVDGIEGARTHRSWWVARSAVRSIRRMDGRAKLTLDNGVTAPVSRTFVQELAERSWLD